MSLQSRWLVAGAAGLVRSHGQPLAQRLYRPSPTGVSRVLKYLLFFNLIYVVNQEHFHWETGIPGVAP